MAMLITLSLCKGRDYERKIRESVEQSLNVFIITAEAIYGNTCIYTDMKFNIDCVLHTHYIQY